MWSENPWLFQAVLERGRRRKEVQIGNGAIHEPLIRLGRPACLFSLDWWFLGSCALLHRIEIWIGLSASFPKSPLPVSLLWCAVCHLNNKCTQFSDLVRGAGLWCILILPHSALYQSPSFIWIKEVEFKNSHCCTGIQIASIYCTEWWNGQPFCPSPPHVAMLLPIKLKKASPLPLHPLCGGQAQTGYSSLALPTNLQKTGLTSLVKSFKMVKKAPSKNPTVHYLSGGKTLLYFSAPKNISIFILIQSL